MRNSKDFINDADYKVCPRIEGVQVVCPYYSVWRAMATRVSSKITKDKQPCYNEVDCCDEWLYFTNFKSWMDNQNWKGMQLDKDILFEGNLNYNPETCAFVPSNINKLLLESTKVRGIYPIGVHYRKKKSSMINEWRNPYIAQLKYKHLGVFETANLAHACWQEHKENKIRESLISWKASGCQSYSEKIEKALLRRADRLKSDRLSGVQTFTLK